MLSKADFTSYSRMSGSRSHHPDYLGREDLLCTVLLCILAYHPRHRGPPILVQPAPPPSGCAPVPPSVASQRPPSGMALLPPAPNHFLPGKSLPSPYLINFKHYPFSLTLWGPLSGPPRDLPPLGPAGLRTTRGASGDPRRLTQRLPTLQMTCCRFSPTRTNWASR